MLLYNLKRLSYIPEIYRFNYIFHKYHMNLAITVIFNVLTYLPIWISSLYRRHTFSGLKSTSGDQQYTSFRNIFHCLLVIINGDFRRRKCVKFRLDNAEIELTISALLIIIISDYDCHETEDYYMTADLHNQKMTFGN